MVGIHCRCGSRTSSVGRQHERGQRTLCLPPCIHHYTRGSMRGPDIGTPDVWAASAATSRRKVCNRRPRHRGTEMLLALVNTRTFDTSRKRLSRPGRKIGMQVDLPAAHSLTLLPLLETQCATRNIVLGFKMRHFVEEIHGIGVPINTYSVIKTRKKSAAYSSPKALP